MIDITKKYRTRDGREVTGLHRGDGRLYPIVGFIEGDYQEEWTSDGRAWVGEIDDGDLIEDTAADAELAELRAFRDAAIAKYPDLAPVDPIEVEVARIYGEWDGDDVTHAIRATLLRGIEIGKGGVA